jgi:hypothetical protein
MALLSIAPMKSLISILARMNKKFILFFGIFGKVLKEGGSHAKVGRKKFP